MYKIFFGDRVLVISNKVNQLKKYNGLYYRYDCKKELKKLVASFVSELVNVPVLVVESEDPDVVFQVLRDSFSYITAAGGLVRCAEHKILCIYRLGKWDLPKGKMETGEKPEQTALREVEEECGIQTLTLEHELPSTYHVYQKDAISYLKRTYWFAMSASDTTCMIPQAEEGIKEVRLFDEDEMKVVLHNTYASIRELLTSPPLNFSCCPEHPE